MQFEISDEAAITFSHVLYEAIADGYPLDASMAEARKAVRNQPNATEWGTPVLYLRAPDGRIFDMSQALLAPPAGVPVAERAPQRTHVPTAVPSETDAQPSAADKDTTKVAAEADELEPVGDVQTSSRVGTATTSNIESPVDEGVRDSAGDTKEHVAGPVGPGSTEIAPRRRRWLPATVVAAGLLIVVGVVAMIALHPNDQEGAAPATSPFDAGLLAAASPYFPADACGVPTPEEAPLAAQLPLTEVIKCGDGGQYSVVLWCTDTQSKFAESRGRYLASATDTPIEITSTPAGQDSATDGVQQAYHHSDGDEARVYWDSPSALCGAELQSTSTDVGAAVNFWHNGAA
jgi:hypothetical protein